MGEVRRLLARQLTPGEQAEVHQSAWSAREIARRNTASVRRLGFIVGTCGMIIGAGGILLVASLLPLRRTEVRFMTVDRQTGAISEAVGAANAPRLFGDSTKTFYLRAVITACQTIVPIVADLQFHHCAVMLDPAQQSIFAARDRSVRNKIGRAGFVRVEDDGWRYSLVEERSGKAGVTYVYIVRYWQSTYDGSTAAKPEPWYCTIAFTFHPDWKMSDDDRAINPAGFLSHDYQCQSEYAGPTTQ